MRRVVLRTLFTCDNKECKSVIASTAKQPFYARKHAIKHAWRFDKEKIYCDKH